MHSSETLAVVIAPFLAAIAGALIYGFASNPKLAEIGRLMYAAGILWLVYLLGGVSIHIG